MPVAVIKSRSSPRYFCCSYKGGYNEDVETGIRNAKNTLSALIKAAQAGEEVFLTHRGERVAAIVAVHSAKDPKRGRGMWKGKLPINWEEDFLRAKRQTEADFYNE
jgi:prevent-host-death family protein